jgi:hypothetical protein
MEKRKSTHQLSRSDGFGHIENYYQSGLRPSQYCKQHGITKCQFYGWRKRYLIEHPELKHPETSVKGFHKISIEDCSDTRISGLEIHYPHGVKVVIGSNHPIEIETLRLLIQLQP